MKKTKKSDPDCLTIPSLGIIKQNAAEAFFKARATLRVDADAVPCFLEMFNALSEAAVEGAEANAKRGGRTSIMGGDVVKAMTSAAAPTLDLPVLFKQIEHLNAKNTADMTTLIQNWFNTHFS